MDRQSRFAIDAVACFDHVVLHVAANSVLWSEERTEIDIRMVVQQISSVTIRVID
jgi:hypothetical protein